jgi:malate synthase
MNKPIYVVSGLPRSGTSMMMKMLEAGGLGVVTDEIREADEDNPRGYYELEKVKQTASDASWVPEARGKVVKVISQLLRDLPESERYKVVFMRRKLDEILASQKKMLDRRGEENESEDQDMKESFAAHIEEIEAWLRGADHVEVLFVNYNRMLEDPAPQIERLNRFLDAGLDPARMAEVVEPALYRNRG